MIMKYKGSCHCKRISYEVEGDLKEAMECNCSHCSRKGYLLWFLPKNKIKLLTPIKDMSVYTFNKHVIKHYFCPVCGCAPFGFGSDGKGEKTVAINVRTLEDIDISSLKINKCDGKNS